MKSASKILTFILSLTTTIVFSQTYHSFPTNGTWVYQRLDDFWQPYPEWETFTLSGDTLIDNHAYRKLALNSVYNGAIRDSAQRIYFRSAVDTIEHILYDFNLTIGDTLIAPYPMEALGYSCDTTVVRWIDSLVTTDGYRRRLNMWGCNVAEWIEGIGNTFWLTSPTYLASLSGGYQLTCFYDSTQLVYYLSEDDCNYFVSTHKLEPFLQISVYPNPTVNLLTFTNLPSTPSSTIVSDLFGRRLLFYADTPNDIDVSELPAGIYFLIVYTKTASQTLRIQKIDYH